MSRPRRQREAIPRVFAEPKAPAAEGPACIRCGEQGPSLFVRLGVCRACLPAELETARAAVALHQRLIAEARAEIEDLRRELAFQRERAANAERAAEGQAGP